MQQRPLLVAVLHEKGGCGKTTVATNLAAYCHINGLRTQLVDADPMGGAFAWAEARQERETETGKVSRLDGIVTVRVDGALLSKAYRDLARPYDVTIVDGPPRLDKIVGSVATAADIILVPSNPSQADLTPLGRFLRLLEGAAHLRAERGDEPSRLGFVINRAVSGISLHREVYGALAEHGEVAGTLHNRVVYQRAYGAGESVFTLEPNGEAAREFRRLARGLGFGDGALQQEAAE